MSKQSFAALAFCLAVSSCTTVTHECANNQTTAPLPTLHFDDTGALVKGDEDTLKTICHDIAASPQTVVVFMHGWKGTDKPSDRNVRCFQAALKEVRDDSYSTGPRKLTGVYLTWKSRHLPGPLEYLAYNRTQVRADRIARGVGISDALEALSAATRRHRGEHIIVAGHSYGARILGGVVRHRPEVLRNVDLMLLANSADDAEACANTVRAVHRIPYQRGTLPKLVWVTSGHDSITKRLYYIGNWKETVGHKRRYQSHIVSWYELIELKGSYRAKIEPGSGVRSRYAHNLLIAEGLKGHSDVWNEPMRQVVNYYLFH
jgi:pimeloyl-ACP methyl ester carboxylesterase